MTEQAVEPPTEYDTAPSPLPPEVVRVWVEPNAAGDVTFTDSAA